MKLWHLEKRRVEDPGPEDPFYCDYGARIMDDIVVRALNEEEARKMAQASGADERRAIEDIWLKPEHTTCRELLPGGKTEVIVVSYYERGE